jgi:amino acid transporter
VLGPVVRALPILISISALGTANASLFGGGRYCMVGSQYGYLPEVFSCIHIHRLTPLPSIVFQVGMSDAIDHFFSSSCSSFEGLIAVIFCIPSNVGALIDFFSFTSWIFYGLTFTATLCCKFTKRDAERVLNVSRTRDNQEDMNITILGSYSNHRSRHSHCHFSGGDARGCCAEHRLSRCWLLDLTRFGLLLSFRLPEN